MKKIDRSILLKFSAMKVNVRNRTAEVVMDLPASMYLNYLARRKADHDRLTAALAKGAAMDDFKTIGHQIKGNAASFGFNELVLIGEQMEKLSEPLLVTDGKRLLGDFKNWIDVTEKRLERELPKEER